MVTYFYPSIKLSNFKFYYFVSKFFSAKNVINMISSN